MCDYHATAIKNLTAHQHSEHEGRIYPCNLCDYRAAERGGLTKHPQSVHKENGLHSIVKKVLVSHLLSFIFDAMVVLGGGGRLGGSCNGFNNLCLSTHIASFIIYI